MKNRQKGFAMPLLLLIIALLVVGGGVYVYETKKAMPIKDIFNNLQSNNQATSTDQAQTSTSSDKQVNNTLKRVERDGQIQQNIVRNKTTPVNIVLSPGAPMPSYDLPLAGGGRITWQFGRDYVDITVQVDNRCSGPTCPSPPINFIARDLKNTGSYNWLIGDWMIAANGYVHGIMPGGTYYTVTVRDSVTKEVFGSAEITLESSYYSSSYITVTAPNGGEKLNRGEKIGIKWSTWPLKKFASVKISVINPIECPPAPGGPLNGPPNEWPYQGCVGTGAIYVLAKDVSNTGAFTWRVGYDIDGKTIPSDVYKVQVEAPAQAFDDSDQPFTIQ